MPKKILVIDDDPDVRYILKILLEATGYKVVIAANGQEGLEKARDNYPDLILLDIMMPGMDGWEACRHLRQIIDVPIIMLTVLGKEKEIVHGLSLGADDFITKPWSNRELLARISAILRRTGVAPVSTWRPKYSLGDLVIDHVERKVTLDDRRIYLTPIEFRLLTYLTRYTGYVLTHSELIAHIWGMECEEDVIRLRWHIHNLRQKIEKNPESPQYLLGKRGVGYYFTDQVQSTHKSIAAHGRAIH